MGDDNNGTEGDGTRDAGSTDCGHYAQSHNETGSNQQGEDRREGESGEDASGVSVIQVTVGLCSAWGYTMTTMHEKYRDGSDHIVCDECGFCIPCGDCICLENIEEKWKTQVAELLPNVREAE